MSQATSPSTGKPYGLARVCRLWGVARSTVSWQRHERATLKYLDRSFLPSPSMGDGPHLRQDKPEFPLITCRYAAIGSPSCWLASQR